MSTEPVCNLCQQPCNLRQIDNPVINPHTGAFQRPGFTLVSWCCGASYTMKPETTNTDEEVTV